MQTFLSQSSTTPSVCMSLSRTSVECTEIRAGVPEKNRSSIRPFQRAPTHACWRPEDGRTSEPQGVRVRNLHTDSTNVSSTHSSHLSNNRGDRRRAVVIVPGDGASFQVISPRAQEIATPRSSNAGALTPVNAIARASRSGSVSSPSPRNRSDSFAVAMRALTTSTSASAPVEV